MNTTSGSNYYDIDAILAEEVSIPCNTNFDFNYLSHLDPNTVTSAAHQTEVAAVLPKNTTIHIPLWCIYKWISLGFISIGIPKQYRLKFRQLLNVGGGTNSSSALDLTGRAAGGMMCYYHTGKAMVDVLQSIQYTSSYKLAQGKQREQYTRLVTQDSVAIQASLLSTYVNTHRFCQLMNTALTNDSSSCSTDRYTTLEHTISTALRTATQSHALWKQYQFSRCIVQQQTSTRKEELSKRRQETAANEFKHQHPPKRVRVQ